MKESRFINPFTDVGFKMIFGSPASKDLLITLLNERKRSVKPILRV